MRWAKEHAAARYNLANSGLLGCSTAGSRPGARRRPGQRAEPRRLSASAGGDRRAVRRPARAGGHRSRDLRRQLPRLRGAGRAGRRGAGRAAHLRAAPRRPRLPRRPDPPVRAPLRERLSPGPRRDPLAAHRTGSVSSCWRIRTTRAACCCRRRRSAGLARLAERAGAYLLVDEVYRDVWFEEAPPSHVHLGPNVLATSSLTKSYGLSGLRCGWILCAPDVARRLWLHPGRDAGRWTRCRATRWPWRPSVSSPGWPSGAARSSIPTSPRSAPSWPSTRSGSTASCRRAR